MPASLQHSRLRLPTCRESREPAGPPGPVRPWSRRKTAGEGLETPTDGMGPQMLQQPLTHTGQGSHVRLGAAGGARPVPTGRSSRTAPPPAVKPGRRWTGRGRAGTGLGSGGRRRPRTRGLSCMSHVPTTGPRRGEPSPSTDCPGRCAGHTPHQDATPRGSLHRVALADSRIYWDRFPRGAGKGLVLAESMSTPGGQDKAPGPPTQPTRAAGLPAVPESRSAPLLPTGAPHAGWTGNVPVGWPEAAWQDSPVLGGRGERAAPRQAASASLLFRCCLSPTRPVFSRKARNWGKKTCKACG